MPGSFPWVLGHSRSGCSKTLNQLCGTMARAARRNAPHGQALSGQRPSPAAQIAIHARCHFRVSGRNHAVIWPLSRSSGTAGTSMPFNLTRGDTRPILVGLAIATLLGWGLFIYAELHGAAQNQKARQQIRQLTTA